MTTATVRTIDIAPKDHWTETERANVEAVLEFVQLLMNEHAFETLRARYGASRYVQHNRNIPDGVEGVLGYVENLVRRYPEYGYDVKHVYADGEHVTIHSHVTLKHKHRGDDSQGLNIVDTWRVVDGQLAEHWDAVQPLGASMRLFALVTGGRLAHDNGVF